MSKLDMNLESPKSIWEMKVGYDAVNKRMIAKVLPYLYEALESNTGKATWTNIVKQMLIVENKIGKVNVNGYYSTIRTILKDIKAIEAGGFGIRKGVNWDRFISDDEDWSWFTADTNCGGYGKIVK